MQPVIAQLITYLFSVIQEIIDLVSHQHYQIACQRYFEAVHHHEIDGGIQHPNQYFQESQKSLNGGTKDVKPVRKAVPTTFATLNVKEEVKTETSALDRDSDDDYNYSTLDI